MSTSRVLSELLAAVGLLSFVALLVGFLLDRYHGWGIVPRHQYLEHDPGETSQTDRGAVICRCQG
jgi:hypothetical protein